MNWIILIVLLGIAYVLYNSGAVFLGTLAALAAIIWLLVESSGNPKAKGSSVSPQYAYPPYPPYPTEIKFKPSFGGDSGPVTFAKGVGGILNTFVKIGWGITRGGKEEKK